MALDLILKCLTFSIAMILLSSCKPTFKLSNTSALFSLNSFCEGQPAGVQDTSFGTNGFFQLDIANSDNATPFASKRAITTPNNDIYVSAFAVSNGGSNSPVIIKLNENGALDLTFDINGYKIFDLGFNAFGQGIQIYSNNIFLSVNGASDNVLKMDLDGNLDNSFGTNGVVTNPNSTTGDGLYVSNTGMIYQTGHTLLTPDPTLTATRFNPSGTIDNTFANNGYLTSSQLTESFGHILVFSPLQDSFYTTTEYFAGGRFRSKVEKFTLDGNYDPTFGTNGVQVFDTGGNDQNGRIVKFSPSGATIFAMGTSDTNATIHHLDAITGAPIIPWGTNGTAVYNIGDFALPLDLRFGSSGLWAIMRSSIGGVQQLVIARFEYNTGQLDTSFNGVGYQSYPWPGGLNSTLASVHFDNQDRALLAFRVSNGADNDIGLMRFCFDPVFTPVVP